MRPFFVFGIGTVMTNLSRARLCSVIELDGAGVTDLCNSHAKRQTAAWFALYFNAAIL